MQIQTMQTRGGPTTIWHNFRKKTLIKLARKCNYLKLFMLSNNLGGKNQKTQIAFEGEN